MISNCFLFFIHGAIHLILLISFLFWLVVCVFHFNTLYCSVVVIFVIQKNNQRTTPLNLYYNFHDIRKLRLYGDRLQDNFFFLIFLHEYSEYNAILCNRVLKLLRHSYQTAWIMGLLFTSFIYMKNILFLSWIVWHLLLYEFLFNCIRYIVITKNEKEIKGKYYIILFLVLITVGTYW